MKIFIKKILLFFIPLFAAGIIGDHLRNPYYGNKVHSQKINILKEHAGEFNTVFMGSSRVYRQLNPELFDSLLTHLNLHTYNLASPASFNPESYFLYEQLLEEDNLQLKYAILEIAPMADIGVVNVASQKSFYWQSVNSLQYCYDYLQKSRLPSGERTNVISKYLLSYLIGKLDLTRFSVSESKKEEITYNLLKTSRDGYMALDDDPNSSRRLVKFGSDTTVAQKRINAASFISTRDYTKQFNQAHFAKLTELKEKSRLKGITLKFLIPPKLSSYSELMALRQQMPDDVIELASYAQYPEFYLSRYTFDEGHLNKTGSKLLTATLAEKFNTLVKQ
jgi:hypothetical protein